MTTASVVDPVDHDTCDPDVAWTSGNVAEAFPGVCTALGFTFMHGPVELALRSAFRDLGVFTDADVHVPERIEQQFWTVFAGRAAANMDQFRALADLTPGTSASAVERQLFGYVRPQTVDRNTYRRYPAIAAKAPLVLARLGRDHDACFRRLRRWRSHTLPQITQSDPASCWEILVDAQARFREIMRLHFLATFVGNGLVDKLGEVGPDTGSGLAATLLSGVDSDENRVAADLWALAHGGLEMTTFLDRHGYHGPYEGQLDSVSWREDPTLLTPRLEEYRALGVLSARAPAARSAAQRADRIRSVAMAGSQMSLPRRKAFTRLVALAGRFLALREQGKAGYLISFDVARAAARQLGRTLSERGVLADPADVFHLTYEELDGFVRRDSRSTAAEHVPARRARYEQRRDQRLPNAWTGVPEPQVPLQHLPASAGTTIAGIAASSGVVEGWARVVTDPETTELRDGDLLVCEATDPGWISAFVLAGGVATDLGGMLSHGAIVARELGIPAVTGTKVGSRTVRNGQRIRIDGDRGVVEILDSPILPARP